jgi:hypothetical protein
VAELNIGVFSLLVQLTFTAGVMYVLVGKCPVKLSVKKVFIYATAGVVELNIGSLPC